MSINMPYKQDKVTHPSFEIIGSTPTLWHAKFTIKVLKVLKVNGFSGYFFFYSKLLNIEFYLLST